MNIKNLKHTGLYTAYIFKKRYYNYLLLSNIYIDPFHFILIIKKIFDVWMYRKNIVISWCVTNFVSFTIQGNVLQNILWFAFVKCWNKCAFLCTWMFHWICQKVKIAFLKNQKLRFINKMSNIKDFRNYFCL